MTTASPPGGRRHVLIDTDTQSLRH